MGQWSTHQELGASSHVLSCLLPPPCLPGTGSQLPLIPWHRGPAWPPPPLTPSTPGTGTGRVGDRYRGCAGGHHCPGLAACTWAPVAGVAGCLGGSAVSPSPIALPEAALCGQGSSSSSCSPPRTALCLSSLASSRHPRGQATK